jgi:hypothetical protein
VAAAAASAPAAAAAPSRSRGDRRPAKAVRLSDMRCDKCGTRYNDRTWLGCISCGIYSHPPCLEPPLDRIKLGKYVDAWQCADCKLCTICTQEGEDAKLVRFFCLFLPF